MAATTDSTTRPPAPAAPRDGSHGHAESPAAFRVLIADASADDRAALRRLLQPKLAGSRFAEADTAAAAVAAVRDAPPDVLLLDNDLPDADAAAVLRQIAVARGAVACPTVVFLGEADEASAGRLLRIGAGDYLSKSEALGRADALARAVTRARDAHRLARRAAVYRANTLLKRRRERDALDRAEAAVAAAESTRRGAESDRERLSLAVSAAELGTWDWYPESGRLIHNDRLVTMLGYAPGEIAWGYSFWRDALHPDDRDETVRRLGEHLEGRSGQFRAEARLRGRDGTWRWIMFAGKVFARDERGRPTRITGTHQDVDARKRGELALLESRDAAERTRQRLGDILTSIRDAFVALDARWRFTLVNPQAEALLGRPAAELLGRSIYEVFPGLRGGPFEAAMNSAMLDGRPAALVAQFKPLDKWFDARFYAAGDEIGGVAGHVAGISIFFLDITAFKQQERQIRESEALARRRLRQLDSIYNTAPAGLAFIDRDLRYVAANARLAAIHDRSVGDLIGKRLADVLTDDMLQRILPIYERVLRDGTPHRVEMSLAGDGRPPRTISAEYVPVIDADGRVEGVNVVATDVTDRKRAEVALQAAMRNADDARVSAERAKEIAERASSAKSEFLAVLSHELRTPLTPVLAGVQMLQGDLAEAGRDAADLGETLAMIRRNVELEVRLIDDLLDLTRLTRGKLTLNKKRVDLNASVRHVLETCRGDLEEKEIDVELDLSPEAAGVSADPARLQQVLWNLLKNATKFTDAGGTVTIRTRRQRRRELGRAAGDGDAPAGDAAEEWMVVCEVRDTGVGIDADLLPKVFTAFEQGGRRVTRTFGGLGLGLAISRALVVAHGGLIWVRSDGPGTGASFSVALPGRALERPEPAAAAPPPQAAPHNGRPIRVLLVEDHADTCRLMARFLRRRLKVEVVPAHSVADGLAAFRGSAADNGEANGFDLIISDIGLPDGDGTDLLRRLAALGPNLPPAVALSGYGTEQDVRNSHDAGFRDHLTKPVDLERLEAVVRSMLG